MSETTRFNFDEVFNLPILEFFAFVRYIDRKRRKEMAQMDKMKGKMRIA